MTRDEHKERHELLHKMLDELVADFLSHNDRLLSETTIMELMLWSVNQIDDPAEVEEKTE